MTGIAGAFLGVMPRSAWVANSSAGHNAFSATLRGSSTNSLILRTTSIVGTVSVEVVAREGTTAPGTSSNFAGLNVSSADPRMSATGDVAFLGTLNSATNLIGIWHKPVGSALAPVAVAGGSATGIAGDTFYWFEQPTLCNTSIAFRGFTNGGLQGIWKGPPTTPASVTCIAKTGDNLPGMVAGATIGSLWSPFSNASGKIAFRITSVNAGVETRAIATDTSGTLSVIAKFGDSAPGITGETFDNFDHPIIGDGNRCAFTASTNTTKYGLWSQGTGGALTLVLKIGDVITTSSGARTVADFSVPGSSSSDRKSEVVSMDAAGHILVFVTFDDGGTAEILTAPVP
jgi:hypothetical protein